MERIIWTKHSEAKIVFYHLSKQRVRRILNSPKRIEKGIAPNTIAMMQVAGSKKHPYEIWIMLQKGKIKEKIGIGLTRDISEVKIISAWKYPGKTKAHSETALDFLKQEYSDYVLKEK
ncbi:hypothetical protein JW698_00595 [Candidatus Wolfebacteria bacterium]|nr:hypothetical protein [Candidatus Wolfebacteria bacterium]